MKFTASRLSEGNRLFPDEITIDDNVVTVKSPKLFGGNTKSFPLGQITVSVNSPFFGYCDINLFSQGTSISVHGFTDNDAKKIKRLINESNSAKNSSLNSNSRKNTSNNYRLENDDDFKAKMMTASREADEKINQCKQILIQAMVDADFVDEKSQSEIDDIDFKATKARSYLAGILRKWYDNDRQEFDRIINECAKKADKKIAEIRNEREEDERCKIDDIKDENSILKKYNTEIVRIIDSYDEQLNIEMLKDLDQCEKYRIPVNLFSKTILTNHGFKHIRNFLKDENSKFEYEGQLKILLEIIAGCYFVTNQIKNESEKVEFRFGLRRKSIHEFLNDADKKPFEKIAKIIDCVDTLVDKFRGYNY